MTKKDFQLRCVDRIIINVLSGQEMYVLFCTHHEIESYVTDAYFNFCQNFKHNLTHVLKVQYQIQFGAIYLFSKIW